MTVSVPGLRRRAAVADSGDRAMSGGEEWVVAEVSVGEGVRGT
jgi:hypothetical protein